MEVMKILVLLLLALSFSQNGLSLEAKKSEAQACVTVTETVQASPYLSECQELPDTLVLEVSGTPNTSYQTLAPDQIESLLNSKHSLEEREEIRFRRPASDGPMVVEIIY